MTANQHTLTELLRQRHVIDRIQDDQTRILAQHWAHTWDAIKSELRTTTLALAQLDDDSKASAAIRNVKARDALAIATDGLTDCLATSNLNAADVARRLIAQATSDQDALITTQLPAGHTINLASVDARQIDAIMRRTLDQITVRHWHLNKTATASMKRNLAAGVTLGRNPKQVAEHMVNMVQGDFEGGLTRALVIARTEQLDAYRAAAQAHHNTNRGVLQGWQWYAELDHRTCFPAGTAVTTLNGPMRIEDIRIGDKVLTHTGRFQAVTDTMCRDYSGTMVSVEARFGHVTATSDHPFLIERQGKLEWVEAGKIRRGDRVVSDSQHISDSTDHRLGDVAIELGVWNTNNRETTALHEPVLTGVTLGSPRVPVDTIDLDDNVPIKKPEIHRVAPRTDKSFLFKWDGQGFQALSHVGLWLGLSGETPVASDAAKLSGRLWPPPKLFAARKARFMDSRPSAFLGAVLQPAASCVKEFAASRARSERSRTDTAPLASNSRFAWVRGESLPAVDAVNPSFTGRARTRTILGRPRSWCSELLAAWARSRDTWPRRGITSGCMRLSRLMRRVAPRGAVLACSTFDLGRRTIESGSANLTNPFHNYIVTNVATHYQRLKVYNIEVENDHSYTANGFVVHNCPSCISHHGELHPLDDPGPLDHHQGRCSRLPVTKTWGQLGYPDIDEPPTALDEDAGYQWFQNQSETMQKNILGPKRYDAWTGGRYPVDDWTIRKHHWSRDENGNPVQDWRDSYHVGPVKTP